VTITANPRNPERRPERNDPQSDDTGRDEREPGPVEVGTRSRWRRWGAGALVVAVLAGLVWIVAFSPVLAARSVTVEGTQRLSRAQILAAADVPAGTPLVRVPRGDIARRVERLPEVRSARVELSFPDTVVIVVAERVAAAYRQTGNGHFTYVDATGRSFADLTAVPAALPQLAPSPAVANDTTTLGAMAQISAALPASIRATVAQVTATSPDDITLALRDGRRVVWGDATRNSDKARVLPALLARSGHVYDVSNPDQVFTH
jgi:cell division protein FtsQ